MRIYLGPSGSENLLSENNRRFEPEEIEDKGIKKLISGSLGQYYVTVKSRFMFEYEKITKADFDIIKTEFDRHTSLSLKVEQTPESNTYDTYTVIFDGRLPRPWWKVLSIEGVKTLIYENVIFNLQEV